MFAISELGRKWIQFFLISPSLPRPPRPFSSALLITYSNNNLYYLLTHREVETYSNGRSISRGMRGDDVGNTSLFGRIKLDSRKLSVNTCTRTDYFFLLRKKISQRSRKIFKKFLKALKKV